MTSEFKIRQAGIDDARKIFVFVRDLSGANFEYETFYLDYRNNLNGNCNVYLVAADQNNDPVGFISCHGQTLLHLGGMVYEVQELYVSGPWRKKGVGKALFRALELQLAKREYELLEITTDSSNKEAIELFKKYGFEKTHVKLRRKK